MRLGGVLLSCVLALAPFAGQAQETLADIRQDMSVLFVEIQKLKRELSTSGGTSVALPSGALDRINAIESELQRLTAKTEELEFRVGRVAEDGARRLGDLEFRLCEMETGCDIWDRWGKTPTLGRCVSSTPAVTPAPSPATRSSDGWIGTGSWRRNGLPASRGGARPAVTFNPPQTSLRPSARPIPVDR